MNDFPEFYVKAKLDSIGGMNRVLLKQRGEYVPYVRERTCRAIPNREWVTTTECGVDCHTCSECGKVLYYDADEDCPRYCPSCGAKVSDFFRGLGL